MCLMLVAGVQAQEFWDKKEPQTWNLKECNRLLSDSPWAKSYELATVSARPLEMEADRRDDNVRKISYRVQIRSARPIRHAMIQRAKLNSKYDQMPAERKQAVDANAMEFLTRQFPDAIVVGVEYSASTADFDREMATYWQQQTLELLKNSTYLIARGKRIPPQQLFVSPGAGREFELIFPRMVDGQPIVTADDKSFVIEFQYPAVGQPTSSAPSRRGTVGAERNFVGGGRLVVEFKPKKMSSPAGELIF
jgi:hypothetical protein